MVHSRLMRHLELADGSQLGKYTISNLVDTCVKMKSSITF
jgi:hypothetical protein